MGLDMYAFSLDRSEAFAKPRDVLNYRAPAGGQSLPSGPIVVGLARTTIDQTNVDLSDFDALYPNFDLGSALLDCDKVLPGSKLLHRWHKHPDLHGWMQRRWNAMRWHKKPKEFGFEERVPLTVQDLDDLEHTVRHGRLPKTTGFFFGESDGSELEDDLEFIAKAREALAAGMFVYYTSWW